VSAKTNAMRLLEARGIAYESYDFSPDIHSADGVAAALGFPAGEVYKTLVVLRERGRPMLVLVAGDRELDPRRLARSLREKAVHMASQKQAERLTGLQVGGISSLALLGRGFDVFVDRPALEMESIVVSAGRRGTNLRLRVADLIALTGARAVEATAPPPMAP
jgi:Cys-tRNA(Pro)/Cys-tRNA(Cys) deacylase